jgi:hypothetical protein
MRWLIGLSLAMTLSVSDAQTTMFQGWIAGNSDNTSNVGVFSFAGIHLWNCHRKRQIAKSRRYRRVSERCGRAARFAAPLI